VRRWLVVGALIAVVLVALIPIGRWEDRRHVDDELDGIRGVLQEIGPYDQPQLDAYRKMVWFSPALDCLIYRRGTNPYALEFCFDDQGRVVEGYDRRGSSPRIWSIREEAEKSTIHVDRPRLEALIERLRQPS
jgi:hypothetical protein